MKSNYSRRLGDADPKAVRARIEALENRTLLSVTFPSGTAYGGLHTLQTRVVDLNNDGKPDIVAIGLADNNTIGVLATFVNQGNGVFGTPTLIPTSASTIDAVAVGDFNGDGVPDIAITNAGQASVSVYLGAGSNINSPSPSFLSPVVTTFGTAVNSVVLDQLETGHFGGSSDDLVVLDPNDNNEVLVLPSTGQGHFGTPIPIQATRNNLTQAIGVQNVEQFTIADFTGDGISDIAYALGNHVEVQFGESGGLFSTTAFDYGPVPNNLIEQVQSGVLTSGGKPDLIVPNNSIGAANDVSVLLNNGAGSFGAVTNYPVAAANFVAIGDFDGNGSQDILAANPGTGVQFLANTGTGTFGDAQNITVPVNVSSMEAADLNGDVNADLIVPDTLGLGNGTAGDMGVFIEGASAGGGGGGGGSSSLTGTLTGSAPPASVLAGQKVKIGQTLTVTNGASAVSGKVTGALYLSSNGTIDANSIRLASVSKNVKLKASAKITLSLKASAIPASTPNGTYQLIAQITDPSSQTTDATSSAGSIVVAPPEIDLSGAFSKTPVPGKNGKTSLTFTVSNAGNVAAAGNLAFNVDSSPDGLIGDATVIVPLSKKINIKPGKSGKITISATLTAGSYFLVIQLDPGNAFSDVNLANNTFATAAQVTVS